MIITPNRRGHDANLGAGGARDPSQNLDLIAEDDAQLDLIKRAAASWEQSADTYLGRSQTAFDSWHSRWTGQTIDGRKWGDGSDAAAVWPWPGASDSRCRTVEKIMWQHYTLAMFAVMNMKIQAKSTRPADAIRQSQQMTTLLKWMIYTHMQEEVNRELPLLVNWTNGFGSAVMECVWEQESRLDYATVTRLNLYDTAVLNGERASIDDFLSRFFDDAQMDDLITLVQGLAQDSEEKTILSKRQARAIVLDMRATGAADIPVPYIFKSKPRWTTLRPMREIFFNPNLDDMQHARAIDRIEYVSETDLIDRIETAGYDEKFVDDSLSFKEKEGNAPRWTQVGVNAYSDHAATDFEEKIKLHHFWRRGLLKKQPALFRTIFHESVEKEALHEPCDYQHGQFPFTAIRREFHDRAILSSRGIPEIAYTWEYEIKKQRDGRTDMVDLALRPPLMAPYQDILRMKNQFSPGAAIPERRAGDMRFFPVPSYQTGSIEIEKAVKQDIDEFFGLFGEIDPILKQRRHEEIADTYIEQLKPVVRQTGQLIKQYMPDADVAMVVGSLSRPFHVTRAEIQGEYEITATVDMRDVDPEFLEKKLQFIAQLKQMDSGGILDVNKLIRIGAESIDYTLADEAVQDTGPVTEKEMEDERRAISRIIGSGLAEPLPKAGNFQLRLQTLQTTLQEGSQSSPDFQERMTKGVTAILENRAKYYQNQIQQYTQNPQIGRSLVTQPFSNAAPKLQDSMGNTGAS